MAETPAVTASEAEEILANQPFSRLIGDDGSEVLVAAAQGSIARIDR